jgi:hypothetical protein
MPGGLKRSRSVAVGAYELHEQLRDVLCLPWAEWDEWQAPTGTLQPRPMWLRERALRRCSSGPQFYNEYGHGQPMLRSVMMSIPLALYPSNQERDAAVLRAVRAAHAPDLVRCNALQGTLLLVLWRHGCSAEVIRALLDRGGELWTPDLVRACHFDNGEIRSVMTYATLPWRRPGSSWRGGGHDTLSHLNLLRLMVGLGVNIHKRSAYSDLTPLESCLTADEEHAADVLLTLGGIIATRPRFSLPLSPQMSAVLEAHARDDDTADAFEDFVRSDAGYPLAVIPGCCHVVSSYLSLRLPSARLKLPLPMAQPLPKFPFSPQRRRTDPRREWLPP